MFVTADGAIYGDKGPHGVEVSAEWTDSLPK
jgi:hypothetical protein